MNENERKVVVRRMLLLIAVACIIMGLYTFRLIFLQLVNGDDFKAKATNPPTREHRLAIREYGLTPHHRLTFNHEIDQLEFPF